MEIKTWTRKTNALKAVEKAVKELDGDLLDKAYVTGYEAADIGQGQTQAWAVKVLTEASPAIMTKLQQALGNTAEVVSTYEPKAEPKPLPSPASEEEPKAKRTSNGRNSPYRGKKIFINGGKDAANVYRPGSKSHAAFEFVQKNPGTKFEDLRELGVRIRTVTEMLRHGMARAQ